MTGTKMRCPPNLLKSKYPTLSHWSKVFPRDVDKGWDEMICR